GRLGLELELAAAEARLPGARPRTRTANPHEADSGRSYLRRGTACPKPRCVTSDHRCRSRACEVRTLRMSPMTRFAENPATTVPRTQGLTLSRSQKRNVAGPRSRPSRTVNQKFPTRIHQLTPSPSAPPRGRTSGRYL